VHGLAQALRGCGVRNFQLNLNTTHWEAVTFPSTPQDKTNIRCVARHVQFDFAADRTTDWPITEVSRLMPIAGIGER
jgi:hypothetical protein